MDLDLIYMTMEIHSVFQTCEPGQFYQKEVTKLIVYVYSDISKKNYGDKIRTLKFVSLKVVRRHKKMLNNSDKCRRYSDIIL